MSVLLLQILNLCGVLSLGGLLSGRFLRRLLCVVLLVHRTSAFAVSGSGPGGARAPLLGRDVGASRRDLLDEGFDLRGELPGSAVGDLEQRGLRAEVLEPGRGGGFLLDNAAEHGERPLVAGHGVLVAEPIEQRREHARVRADVLEGQQVVAELEVQRRDGALANVQ